MTPAGRFFETFGFLYLPGVLAGEMEAISGEFDAVWARRPDIQHDGINRTMYPDAFLNASSILARLIEHPVLDAVRQGILGPNYAYYNGDGNYYAGDTGWHNDAVNMPRGDEAKSAVVHIKTAIYLDPITAETGALRVIPGSHHLDDHFSRAISTDLLDSESSLGVPPRAVPAVPLPITPGDVVIFDHRIRHASFGGGPARRMFAMNFFGECSTSRQRELTAGIFRMYGQKGMSYFFSDNVLHNAPPGRLRRLEPALQFDPARAEGYAEYRREGRA
jgi:ectoine hydroxylase-related dioxygenase (phytanoyl-CoA dioxygenase family)